MRQARRFLGTVLLLASTGVMAADPGRTSVIAVGKCDEASAIAARTFRSTLTGKPGMQVATEAETDVTLVYLVDRPFTGEDEFGVAWDDPDIGIDWPKADPILSERDRANPSLRAIEGDLPSFDGRT